MLKKLTIAILLIMATITFTSCDNGWFGGDKKETKTPPPPPPPAAAPESTPPPTLDQLTFGTPAVEPGDRSKSPTDKSDNELQQELCEQTTGEAVLEWYAKHTDYNRGKICARLKCLTLKQRTNFEDRYSYNDIYLYAAYLNDLTCAITPHSHEEYLLVETFNKNYAPDLAALITGNHILVYDKLPY